MGPEANMWICHSVTSKCPVEATVLGYRPNLVVNVFLATMFCICMLVNAVTSSWARTWTYSAFLVAGCSLEFAGYVARTQLSLNPWNGEAFQAQICAIILGPTLICISLYLTLKHITLAVDPSLSRLRPQLYPLVFIPADISCLVLQAIGGRLAAGAGWDHPMMLTSGNRLIIAGISLQCIVLGIFGLVYVEFFYRVSRKVRAGKASPTTCRAWESRRFRWFCCVLLGAYTGIFIRCVYRIAEMAHGWGNQIMQHELSFIVLEGCMVLISVVLLTLFPVRYFFPAIARKEKKSLERDVEETPTTGGIVYAAARPIPSMTYTKQDGTMIELVAVDGSA